MIADDSFLSVASPRSNWRARKRAVVATAGARLGQRGIDGCVIVRTLTSTVATALKKQGGRVNATIFNAFSHTGVNLQILITVKGRLEVGVRQRKK